MARRVFFSFHYTRDSHRVARIRNVNTFRGSNYTLSTFLDRAAWESLKRTGPTAIKNWIDSNMSNTSVVVLCYGLETYKRPWVKYELEKAHREGKGIIAVDMAGMKNLSSQTDNSGPNPLDYAFDSNGNKLSAYDKYKSYSWYNWWGTEVGRESIDEWIEAAAVLARR